MICAAKKSFSAISIIFTHHQILLLSIKAAFSLMIEIYYDRWGLNTPAFPPDTSQCSARDNCASVHAILFCSRTTISIAEKGLGFSSQANVLLLMPSNHSALPSGNRVPSKRFYLFYGRLIRYTFCWFFLVFAKRCNSFFISTGLERCAFIPASKQF